VILRGRTLRLVLGIEAAAAVVAAAVWPHIRGLDPYLATVAFLTFLLGVIAVALAAAPDRDVRWSATRAALLTLLVYVLIVPAMTRVPIDGDEPYYLLMTESLVRDFDLDLRNQYAAPSASGRPDLRPQQGDPTGPNGEQYSRHEPFLALLLVPGYWIGGLHGAVATMALFAALLARSTIRFLEDEGVAERTIRSIFPLIVFGPPIVFYAARIWPEVPAALCFVEAIRGVRQRRPQRWIPALFLLALLKLRFVLVAIPIVIHAVSRSRKHLIIGAAILVMPLLVVWMVSGSALGVHSIEEIIPLHASWYLRGLFGLLLDGAAGIALQAPFYLLGVFALARWSSMPEGFRLGCITSSLYLILLIPRSEWHGGWAPPLRYIVFLTPILALGAAVIWERLSAAVKALIGLWTAGLVVHGIAYPWRLFHIANGENAVGEWLSRQYQTDFSRLFPSFIRMNDAAWVGAVVLGAALLLVTFSPPRGEKVPEGRMRGFDMAVVSLLLAALFFFGQKPGRTIHFEDAHVIHTGGELHPPEYTISRFLYRGGWLARAGDSLSFLARAGRHQLHYVAGAPVIIELAGRVYRLEGTNAYRAAQVAVPRTGRIQLRVIAGEINLDRMIVSE
jgi:hypothetical protein